MSFGNFIQFFLAYTTFVCELISCVFSPTLTGTNRTISVYFPFDTVLMQQNVFFSQNGSQNRADCAEHSIRDWLADHTLREKLFSVFDSEYFVWCWIWLGFISGLFVR